MKRLIGAAAVITAALLSVLTCADAVEEGGKAAGTIKLPPPITEGDFALNEALAARRSVRSFTDRQLTLAEIGQLCWAAQGMTSGRGFRTAPSAGALYPLELYCVTGDGVFRYLPRGHALEAVAGEKVLGALGDAALGQVCVSGAPCVFVFSAVYARTSKKYGERAARYVHIEVGHAAQNLLLEAVALGLGGVPVGAFSDDRVAEVIGLPDDHAPLLLVPVGHPR